MDPSAQALQKAVVINRILVLSLVGTILWEWQLFALLIHTAPWSLLGVVVLVLAVLLIGSVIGLLRVSTRGYYFTYILVPFATMFHGIALIPVITSVLPTRTLRTTSVFVLNCVFLVAAVASHRLARRTSRNGSPSWSRL